MYARMSASRSSIISSMIVIGGFQKDPYDDYCPRCKNHGHGENKIDKNKHPNPVKTYDVYVDEFTPNPMWLDQVGWTCSQAHANEWHDWCIEVEGMWM